MAYNFVVNLNCAAYVNYFLVQNGISPIKRLYIKNASTEDIENVTISVTSSPEFMLPTEITQAVFPARANLRFDNLGNLSPLFMVAGDKRLNGEITVKVIKDNEVLAESTAPVTVLAFDECNLIKPESIATFIKRTPEINKYINLAVKKLNLWKTPQKGFSYSNSNKNSVRNYFAACYAVLAEIGFIRQKQEPNSETEIITDFKEIDESKIATPLEVCILLASMCEGNGYNPIVGSAGGKWFVGCFLSDECFNDLIIEDSSSLIKKTAAGVNEISLISVDGIYDMEAFEKAEKNAALLIKKSETVDYFVDVRRSRILGIKSLPQRVKTDKGYDLIESHDYTGKTAPKKIKEYNADITGETVFSREKQWERRLLELDLRNGLLNFRVSANAVKVLTASLDDFVETVSKNKAFTIISKPNDIKDGEEKTKSNFDFISALKPMAEYIRYEYINKRLHTAYLRKEHDKTLINLFRKAKTLQEESGTASLYVCAGFLQWRENEESEFKFAPLLLYPITISKRGIAEPVYGVEINSEDVQINNTLLEFLYRDFNLDMRGLSNVKLSDPSSILAVVSRIKKEIVDKKGWEVFDNVYINTLSFTNYLMWYDVRNNMEKLKESKLIRSLVNNRIEMESERDNAEALNSDNAYDGEDKLYLPISADSSQYAAIAASLSSSFVLHGPPGTGKSQTITNIIVNNIVRGKRVLFVAEKMAALSVVYKRLMDIGVGDFCLELHSDKTHKTDVLSKIINTLNLSVQSNDAELESKLKEINQCIGKLKAEIDSMHKKRYLGFSLYEAMLNYFENSDAPDCLRIDGKFYEKLTLSSFTKYIDVLTELALRAKECGDIEKSPFKYIGKFDYSSDWREEADAVLSVYLMELKHLRLYARELQTLFNMRTISLTGEKLRALFYISSKLLSDPYVRNYFKNAKTVDNAKGLIESYFEAVKRDETVISEYESVYGKYPEEVDLEELNSALNKNAFLPKGVKKVIPSQIDKGDRTEFLEYLIKCEQNRVTLKTRIAALSELFSLDLENDYLDAEAKVVYEMYENAKILFADCDFNAFEHSCYLLTKEKPHILMEYYIRAHETVEKIKETFETHFKFSGKNLKEEMNFTIDYISNIQKNMDFIPSWCRYQAIVEKCGEEGFDFVLEPLSTGEITAEDVLKSFKKCVYFNFIKSELYLDDVLCQFSGLTLEETMQRFKQLTDEYEKMTRTKLYDLLVNALPKTDTAGDHNLERVILYRAEKTNMQGTTIRNLFEQIPNILKATCPCMLMSPVSVSQYLDINQDKFDLVIFDEASQVPTCEAVGAIARGKNVIVVGDPQQLPPTTFFRTDYKDEEHYDVEDLESILDDCLAIGMREHHLLWHYRSNHESLIAFSNSMFYDNTLLTFPSPNELNSKVSFRYVDGMYERGGSKCNKKEAEVLIKNVIERLKNPSKRGRSIGIVTFNTAQQNYIEDKLNEEIHANGLDEIAFERDEPLFVKNLENVQGDERDIILFSVGYGPDASGKLSLNFGPINQQGGYKRLNVAVTRARTEMCVFSSITGNMIDLNRSDSPGVKAFKAFLEYAERGTDMLSIDSRNIQISAKGIGENVARDLKDRGLICESNVGVSDFKIDVAVVDPRDKDKYVLAIIIDSENTAKISSVRDRMTMQAKILKKLGWNTYNLWSINYFNNSKREINKIKDYVSTLIEKKVISKKTVREAYSKYKANYKSYYIKPSSKSGVDYVLNFVNEEALLTKIRAVIETESPIENGYLLDKLCSAYAVPKTAKKAVAQLSSYIEEYAGFKQEVGGKIFYADKTVEVFRPSDERNTRDIARIHPEEIIAAAKCAVETSLNITKEDIVKEIFKLFNIPKRAKSGTEWVESAVDSAVSKGDILITPEGFLKV